MEVHPLNDNSLCYSFATISSYMYAEMEFTANIHDPQ